MATFTAGQKVRASDLNRACPITFEQECTADYTITSSFGDVTGASITITTSVANAVCIIEANFDFRLVTAGTGYCRAYAMIDGTRHARELPFTFPAAEARTTGTLRIKTTLATAGSHTIKLQAKKDGGGGSALFAANSTVLLLTVYGA